MEHIVGIGEFAISTKKEDVIKTFALSTCVGIVIYDVEKKILAMAHVLLPKAINGNEEDKMAKYADTGIYNLFREMKIKHNCNERHFKITLFGGIDSKAGDIFKVGEKNIAVIKNILDKKNIKYDSTNTGGRLSRTIVAYASSGEIDLKSIPIIYN
jgi:chemotaxis protein CheD